jgi:hypothetical protein
MTLDEVSIIVEPSLVAGEDRNPYDQVGGLVWRGNVSGHSVLSAEGVHASS